MAASRQEANRSLKENYVLTLCESGPRKHRLKGESGSVLTRAFTGLSFSGLNSDEGRSLLNGTPELKAIFDTLVKLDERVRLIDRDGCGVRDGHDEALRNLWGRIDEERKARERMGEKFSDKMNMMRNQILIGMGIMLFVAIILGRIIQ